MGELRAHKIKRLAMRSMRRGIKEMDLILSAYAEAKLELMDDAAQAHYDQLLEENDHDLYAWVSGQAAAPSHYTDVINDIQSAFSPNS